MDVLVDPTSSFAAIPSEVRIKLASDEKKVSQTVCQVFDENLEGFQNLALLDNTITCAFPLNKNSTLRFQYF